MTDPQTKNRGGRPANPAPPQNAVETRALIAREIVRTSPSVSRLRIFYRLLKSFTQAEDAARADERNRLLTEANRLKAAELELSKADYRLRFAQKPLGVRQLLTESERLKARVAELERLLVNQEFAGTSSTLPAGAKRLAKIDCGVMQENSGTVPTLTGKDGHCA